jgi:hypothetical protein
LLEAIINFQQRDRRFGAVTKDTVVATDEQVSELLGAPAT